MTAASELAVNILIKEEGFRDKPYYDTESIPTIGYGFVCGNKYDPLPDITINQDEAIKKLLALVEVNEKTMINNPELYRAYSPCNENQKAILLSMAHQIGIYGILKFKKMLGVLYHADFNGAADQMLDSLAARQTPSRWKRNAEQMRTGELNSYYKDHK
jgi:lysozyme